MRQAASRPRYVFALPLVFGVLSALSFASCSSAVPPTLLVTITEWPMEYSPLTIHPTLPGYSRVPADFQVGFDQPRFLYDLPSDVSGALTLSVSVKDTTRCKTVSGTATIMLDAATIYPQELPLKLTLGICPMPIPGFPCSCP